MTGHPSRRMALACLLAAALALGTVACGSDPEDAGPATTTTVAPSPVTLIEGPGAVEIIEGAGRFSEFLGLVEAAGLGDTVAVGGPWTIFAPDNAALESLDPAQLEALRSDATAARAFVLAHVVAGVWRGPDLLTLGGQTLTTEAATTMSFAVNDGVITIEGEEEGAVVVEPLSLESANAVIHAVNRPLPAPE